MVVSPKIKPGSAIPVPDITLPESQKPTRNRSRLPNDEKSKKGGCIMSERLRQAIETIINFISRLKQSGGRARPEVFMIDSFRSDMREEEKRNRGFVDDFCDFYRDMDEWHPRGSNIYGSGADKHDMRKGSKNAAYRVLVYFDKKNNIMVFLKIYPKDDEKRVLNDNARKELKKLVGLLRAGKLDLIPLSESPA
jgi:mRNA-degrading endonuclease RelE of RelBE toxin-antitoxin system